MRALKLVDFSAAARKLLNRRLLITLRVPITRIKLEPIASAGQLRFVLILLLLLEAALSALCTASHLVAVERSQLGIALRHDAMLPQDRGRARGQPAEIILFNSILADAAGSVLLLLNSAFLGDP